MQTVLNFVKKLSVFSLVAICSSAVTDLFGENPTSTAILGGQGDAPYAAIVRSNRSVMELPGLPAEGLTYRVAMNSSGRGIIGGTEGLNAYAALVSPKGKLTPISGLMAPGEIYTVAIDESGRGIVGGGHADSSVPYAALISSKGEPKSLSMPLSGLIYSVVLGFSQNGIIGGKGPSNSALCGFCFTERCGGTPGRVACDRSHFLDFCE